HKCLAYQSMARKQLPPLSAVHCAILSFDSSTRNRPPMDIAVGPQIRKIETVPLPWSVHNLEGSELAFRRHIEPCSPMQHPACEGGPYRGLTSASYDFLERTLSLCTLPLV